MISCIGRLIGATPYLTYNGNYVRFVLVNGSVAAERAAVWARLPSVYSMACFFSFLSFFLSNY